MFHMNFFELQIVQTEEELEELAGILRRAKYHFYDTETTGKRVRYPGEVFPVGFTFAVEDEVDERVFYIPLMHEFEGEYKSHIDLAKLKLNPKDFPHFDESGWIGKEFYNMDYALVMAKLKPIFEMAKNEREINKVRLTEESFFVVDTPNISPVRIAHNQSYDWHVLANCGIDIDKVASNMNYADTMVMCHTRWEEEEKKLESTIERCFGLKKTDYNDIVATVTNEEKKQLGFKTVSTKAAFQHTQIPIGAQYSAEDVWFMKQLYPELLRELKDDETLDYYQKYRVPFLKVLWDMERRGVKFDQECALQMQEKAKKVLDEIKYSIFMIVGTDFDISSKQQLYELLHGFKKKIKDKKNGGYKESYNEKLIEKSYGFPVEHWTAGGADKDKNIKTPQMNKEAFDTILSKDYKDKRKKQGQEVVRLVKRYNKLQKLYSTYMVGMFKEIYSDGKIHPSFNSCGTDSHRISCDSPNLLNLPRPLEKVKEPKREQYATEEGYKIDLAEYKKDKAEYDFWIQFEIRSLLIPDNKNEIIISSDYNALEKRLTANRSKDKSLVRLFEEKLDPHSLTASFVFPEELSGIDIRDIKKLRPDLRQRGKQVGFSMDYGGTQFSVSRSLGCSKEEAQGYIDNYWKGFKGQAEYSSQQKRDGFKNGFVTTYLHKRHVEKMRTENGAIRGYYERICMNAPIQGSAADVVTEAQLNIANDPVLRMINWRMIIQVYDEIVLTGPKKYLNIAAERIQYHMENVLTNIEMIVPLVAEPSWGETYADAK